MTCIHRCLCTIQLLAKFATKSDFEFSTVLSFPKSKLSTGLPSALIMMLETGRMSRFLPQEGEIGDSRGGFSGLRKAKKCGIVTFCESLIKARSTFGYLDIGPRLFHLS